MFGCEAGEFFSGERGCGCGTNCFRSCTAGGHVAESKDDEALDALRRRWLRLGGNTFGDAVLEEIRGGGIGEKQVISNLLDAPLLRVRDGVELGLGGVEALQRDGEFVVELLDGRVHRQRLLYTAI